jgi:hypothetical protein
MANRFRDITSLLVASGYFLERLSNIAGGSTLSEAVNQPNPAASPVAAPSEDDFRYLADIVYRVNEREIDDIRGWDALNGVLLSAIVAVYLLFVDKIDAFSALYYLPAIPVIATIYGLTGDVLYSPDVKVFNRLRKKSVFCYAPELPAGIMEASLLDFLR